MSEQHPSWHIPRHEVLLLTVCMVGRSCQGRKTIHCNWLEDGHTMK